MVRLAAVTVVGAAFAPAAAGQQQFPPAPQRCFGAASRSVTHPCSNSALRLTVIPTPDQAPIIPSPPCIQRDRFPQDHTSVLHTCRYGVPPATAKRVIVLVGDSHAWHWTAAVQVMAAERGWAGFSVLRTGCPFSLASIALPGALRAQCDQWHRDVLAWFVAHPEASTVLVSEHTGAQVVAAHGENQVTAQEAGYAAAWRALPPTVRDIVVIRDVPLNGAFTLPCVQAQILKRRPADPTCAKPRTSALQSDSAILSAGRFPRPSRVHTVDLTRYFCDQTLCHAVIGGALVYRDIGHLTDAFSASLGPYLGRAVAGAVGPDAPSPTPPASPPLSASTLASKQLAIHR